MIQTVRTEESEYVSQNNNSDSEKQLICSYLLCDVKKRKQVAAQDKTVRRTATCEFIKVQKYQISDFIH